MVKSKARQFIECANIISIPVDIKQLAKAANAKINFVENLEDSESGNTIYLRNQYIITVNSKHQEERQRFTVLHEIGHIILKLPSQHQGQLTSSEFLQYKNRPREEKLCDEFASECLLPHKYFSKDVADMDVSMNSVRKLAEKYKASITSTGSQFVAHAVCPCAFVLSQGGIVRYVSYSESLKELRGRIGYETPIPKHSVAYSLVHNRLSKTESSSEIESHIWFDDSMNNYPSLFEESQFLEKWDQCLSLLWFDQDFNLNKDDTTYDNLQELDGILKW